MCQLRVSLVPAQSFSCASLEFLMCQLRELLTCQFRVSLVPAQSFSCGSSELLTCQLRASHVQTLLFFTRKLEWPSFDISVAGTHIFHLSLYGCCCCCCHYYYCCCYYYIFLTAILSSHDHDETEKHVQLSDSMWISVVYSKASRKLRKQVSLQASPPWRPQWVMTTLNRLLGAPTGEVG